MIHTFLDHEQLTRHVASGALHPEFPVSLLVVVPPTFGQYELARSIRSALAGHPASPPVAIISPDEVRDADAYAVSLSRQWQSRVPIPSRSARETLESYFNRIFAVGAPGRPLLQIVVRFHTILDCLESWMLGLMRTEEQSRRLRSVVLCHYPYSELKRRWVNRGLKLTNSDYGDKHELRSAPLSSLDWFRSRPLHPPVPKHIFEFALAVAGPYPEVLAAVLELWVRRGRSGSLDRSLRAELREQAVTSTMPFIRHLDAPGQTIYLEHLIDLHLHAQSDARYHIEQHPWAPYLVDSEGNLRSECLGEAAQRFWAQTEGNTSLASINLHARRLYDCRQYGAVVELGSSVPRRRWPPAIQLVKQHARIMFAVFGQCGDEAAGEDSDWHSVSRSVDEARELLPRVGLDDTERAIMECRYSELQTIAGPVCTANTGGQSRVVDRLGGLAAGNCEPSPHVALLLVLCSVEAGRALTGNSSAIRAVLPVPEQIYRLWAFWRLGLNYYRAAATPRGIWQSILNEWPHGDVQPPVAGTKFPSFELFAYYAMAVQVDRGLPDPPEPTWKALRQALSLLEVRNDVAHAVVTNDPKRRSSYFELIDRWLDSLIAACPEPTSRGQLLAIVEPLPLPA
jgi:hypothetical protein